MKEAGSEAAGRRTETGYEAAPSRASGLAIREALVTKARRRRSGGRAAKADALTRGDLASCLKGRHGREVRGSEKSAEVVVAGASLRRRTERWEGRQRPLLSEGPCPRSRGNSGVRAETSGEAARAVARWKLTTGEGGNERSGMHGAANGLMELVCERQNLTGRAETCRQNKGSPGIDGMTVEELPAFLKRTGASPRGTARGTLPAAVR